MVLFAVLYTLILTGIVAIEPEQVHIALAGKDGMRISWFTMEESADPYCLYGTSPDTLSDLSHGKKWRIQLVLYWFLLHLI